VKLGTTRLRLVASLVRTAAQLSTRMALDRTHRRALADRFLRLPASYEDSVRLAQLPETSLHQLFPGIDQQTISLAHRHETWTIPYGEAFVLAAIASYVTPHCVFEFGTYTGAGTLAIARHSPDDCTVFTLDLPADRLRLPGIEAASPGVQAARIGEAFKRSEVAHKIRALQGDSARFDFSPFRGKVDLVFIDAVHTYEYVRNDTQRALEMLSPAGTIVWDDCSLEFPGVVNALREFQTSRKIHRIAGTRLAVYSRFFDSYRRNVASGVASATEFPSLVTTKP
jgi:predicted O-methyltransferase YrrM